MINRFVSKFGQLHRFKGINLSQLGKKQYFLREFSTFDDRTENKGK